MPPRRKQHEIPLCLCRSVSRAHSKPNVIGFACIKLFLMKQMTTEISRFKMFTYSIVYDLDIIKVYMFNCMLYMSIINCEGVRHWDTNMANRLPTTASNAPILGYTINQLQQLTAARFYKIVITLSLLPIKV